MPAQLFQMPGRRPAVNEQVGGHIPQGQQDKGPLCHARMRQGAEFRCAAFLTIEQQININGAGAGAQRRIRAAHTSKPLFQIQQGPQQLLRRPEVVGQRKRRAAAEDLDVDVVGVHDHHLHAERQ